MPIAQLALSSCWDNGFLDGMIDELRVSTACRWTHDFTPPTRKYRDPWQSVK